MTQIHVFIYLIMFTSYSPQERIVKLVKYITCVFSIEKTNAYQTTVHSSWIFKFYSLNFVVVSCIQSTTTLYNQVKALCNYIFASIKPEWWWIEWYWCMQDEILTNYHNFLIFPSPSILHHHSFSPPVTSIRLKIIEIISYKNFRSIGYELVMILNF